MNNYVVIGGILVITILIANFAKDHLPLPYSALIAVACVLTGVYLVNFLKAPKNPRK